MNNIDANFRRFWVALQHVGFPYWFSIAQGVEESTAPVNVTAVFDNNT
jgi:hypothetical protein